MRHGENVIEFHIHVKLHIFRCTSRENVIKFHAHVKWHVFKTASREIVIKFHVGAYQVKMSLNYLYTPNDVVRCVPWENIIKYNIHAKRQVFRGFLLENVIECHMHVSWHVLGVCHGKMSGERGGSVVECRTPEREVRGSRPTAAVLCPWARHFTPRKYWLITQEAMAPSRYDWKIVDWDVKPQHNQH